MRNNSEKIAKILVAPLNWGIGHATRCIPIINALIKEGFEPIIASDGDALLLLQKEFPKLQSFSLPAYNIQYTKNGKYLAYRLLWDSIKIKKAVDQEKKIVAELIENEKIKGIISDNRFGVRSEKIPSVYISHQLTVISGLTSRITSFFHQRIILKFDECWVPDYAGKNSLAGKLSHLKASKIKTRYLGPISRFNQKTSSIDRVKSPYKFDLMILLSGPEPQRSILENMLLNELKSFSKKVLFVRGVISDKAKEITVANNKNIKIVNYMLQDELKKSINESKIILARSGYSTIMDLDRLNAKAFFIPTPGQFEQEYLAKYLEEQKIAPYTAQDKFEIKLLDNVKNYVGFKNRKEINKTENSFSFNCFIQ